MFLILVIVYFVFCLGKNTKNTNPHHHYQLSIINYPLSIINLKRNRGTTPAPLLIYNYGITLPDRNPVNDNLSVLGGLQTIDGLADGVGAEAVVNLAFRNLVDGEAGLAAVDVRSENAAVSL